MVFTATGGVFALLPSPTVTLTVWAALAPSGSAAVTVTTAPPDPLAAGTFHQFRDVFRLQNVTFKRRPRPNRL